MSHLSIQTQRPLSEWSESELRARALLVEDILAEKQELGRRPSVQLEPEVLGAEGSPGIGRRIYFALVCWFFAGLFFAVFPWPLALYLFPFWGTAVVLGFRFLVKE